MPKASFACELCKEIARVNYGNGKCSNKCIMYRLYGGNEEKDIQYWMYIVEQREKTPCRRLYFQVDCMQYEDYWHTHTHNSYTHDFIHKHECLNYCIYHVINIIQIQHESQTIEFEDIQDSSWRRDKMVCVSWKFFVLLIHYVHAIVQFSSFLYFRLFLSAPLSLSP